jgi:rare lipoprotein A
MVEVERVFEPEAPGKTAAPPPSTQEPKPSQAQPSSDKSASAAAPEPEPAAIVTPVVAQEPAGLWIQLGAFASAEGARSFSDHVARDLDWLHEPVQVSYRDGVHRVRLGPYRNREEASAIAGKVERSLGIPTAVSNTR